MQRKLLMITVFHNKRSKVTKIRNFINDSFFVLCRDSIESRLLRDNCDICNNPIPHDDVIASASASIKSPVSFIDTGEAVICPNCIAEVLQYQRMLRRGAHLLLVYSNNMKLNKYDWSDIITTIDCKKFVDNILLLKEFSNDESYRRLTLPIRYTEITVKGIFNDYNDMANKVTGVCLPNDASINTLKPNTISCPKDIVGLIRLPRDGDFVVMDSSNFDNMSILELSLNEMKQISKGLTSPRAGAAGGFMFPSGTSKSLSPITFNQRLMTMRKTSVAMSLTYKNKDDVVKGRNSIYQDLYMQQYTSKQKFRAAIKSKGLQRIMIKEMISRLRSFLVIHNADILQYHTTVLSFLKSDEQRIEMESQFRNAGVSRLDSRLLSWACTTGEMRNHQAVKAHLDGNKSHPVETMTIFGRVPTNLTRMNINILEQVDYGYLLLPLEGVTLKIKCGFDIVHCSLRKTVHLADNSRNTCNWSKVHGP